MSKRSQQIDGFFRQGQQLHMAGRLSEAEQIYRQVIAAAPRHADALHALGALALQSGRPAEAGTLIDRAIALKPAAEYQLTRAHTLLALHRAGDAARTARLVLRARPHSAEAHQVLGHALADGGEPEQAVEAYRAALRLNPALPDIRNNLGMALRQANRLADAEQELRQAPPEPEALVNLSSVQKERGATAEAEATLRQALRIAPDDPVLRYNWSLLMLLLGRSADAWEGWEQRFRAGAVPARRFSQPQWQGEPLGHRTLLVHTEQGLGDVIQFARFLPGLRAFGSVLFEVPQRLMRLLSSNKALPPMVAAEASPPQFDVVIPLLSLPSLSLPSLSLPAGSLPAGSLPAGSLPVGSLPVGSWPVGSLPVGSLPAGSLPAGSLPAGIELPQVQPPYLFAEPDRVAYWRDRIGSGGIRVGINWQGNPSRFEDRGRSFALALFAPLAAVPGVRLISLQKDAEPIADFPVEVLDRLDAGADAFVDTAAVMQSLDLIVTSDTSIAHLGGALGRPVWVALRRVPDWRWMLDRADSPWYPTMRLFRQQTDGEWPPLFAAMAEALVSRT